MHRRYLKIMPIFILLSQTVFANDLYEKSLNELLSMETQVKADVGSRSGSREFLDSNVPIKVITNKQIQNSGLKQLTQLLTYFVSGFNSPSPAIKDGSDHISMGTLRGLNPDQVLVLIDGKRLHNSALIHVNDTVGRGSSSVDLNTIPVTMIEHIEILSDGAAAQYGSDAIAGVINIILKANGHTNSVSSNIGSNIDGGGNTYQADLFYSKALDYDGYMNITSAVQKEESSSRTRLSNLSPQGNLSPLGNPDSMNYTLGMNLLLPQDNDMKLYSRALFNYRDSTNNAYYRDADTNTNTMIYPDGFLPMINLQMSDISFVTGVKGEAGKDTSWDLSQAIGYNRIDYRVNNSMNYALGATSPTSFDAGGLDFFQATTNFDLKQKYSFFNLAAGLEFRYESFGVNAGESASYEDGNQTTKAGSQGFPGFQAKNEISANRNNVALYLQVDKKIADLSVELATRLENYSDFGATSDYKLSFAYKAMDSLLLRASGSTGFRAPSLSQSYFSASGTTISDGILFKTDTLRTSDPVAISLGAKELKAEESIHFTTGFVYQAQNNLSFSADYFYTKIDDRIMLSGDIDYDADNNGINDSKARFFTNAVNTQTQGVDVSLIYQDEFQNGAKFNFNGSYSFSRTEILSFNDTIITGLDTSLTEKERIENSQPKDYIKLLFNYELQSVNIALNINRTGEFNDVYKSQVQTFSPQWTTDLDMAYTLSKEAKIAIGGINIFNIYPDAWNDASSPVQYSQYSPLGYNGAYYYVRGSYEF